MVLAVPVNAFVLCTRRIGAPIRIREVCKITESQVNLTVSGTSLFSPPLALSAASLEGTVSVSSLHVKDGAGQDLGYFIGTDGSQYQTVLESLGVIAQFATNLGQPFVFIPVPADQVPLYTGTNCTGDLYIRASAIVGSAGVQGIFYIDSFIPTYGRIQPGSSASVVTFSSTFTTTTGSHCLNYPSSVTAAFLAFPGEEIDLPFTEPLTWPLHLESVP